MKRQQGDVLLVIKPQHSRTQQRFRLQIERTYGLRVCQSSHLRLAQVFGQRTEVNQR